MKLIILYLNLNTQLLQIFVILRNIFHILILYYKYKLFFNQIRDIGTKYLALGLLRLNKLFNLNL